MELMVIEGEIKTRRSPPRSLDQLRTASEEPHQVHVDGWDRPFLYLVDGEDYSVLSYGRDGKPGGTGLDSDLASDDPWRSGTDATLAQFLIEMPTEGIIGACVVSGGIAFLVCLLTVKRTDFADGNALRTAVKLILTTIGALAASAVMSALHIPTGH